MGGSIGYKIATLIKEAKWIAFFGEEKWQQGKNLVTKYGVMAIFIGGITPLPDFLLAYVAGFVRMSYIPFASSDALARFIRSALVLMLFQKLGILIDLDIYGTYILYAMFFYMFMKMIVKKVKNKIESNRSP